MHGLINRSIQCFLRDVHGTEIWNRVARSAGLSPAGFETMFSYDDAITVEVVEAAAARLAQSCESLLEDLGGYLVSHPNMESLRRLLRFGGVDFLDFLLSLEDLPERAQLAVPDLELPRMELHVTGTGTYRLICSGPYRGYGHVILGMLRAMADDYGALVLTDHLGTADGSEQIAVELLQKQGQAGRHFQLAAHA